MPKHIIFFNTNVAWGGGEKWHFEMALALKERSYQVSLITGLNSELAIKAREHGLTVHSFKIKNLSFLNPIKLIQLSKVFFSIRPNCVILNSTADVKICAPLAKLAGVDKVIYRRGLPKPLKNNLINKLIFNFVDLFIANSVEISHSISKNLPYLKSKIRVIYNGVHINNQKYSPNFLQHKVLTLGNLGRLVAQKGQFHLLKIAHILKRRNIKFQLLIAGKGKLEAILLNQVKELNLEEEVRLLGYQQSEEFFPMIDIFVFSSEYEGSANALIEALQHQKPAIAFDLSSNSEVIISGKTGYLVKPYDYEDFADKIILLSSPDGAYSKMVKSGQMLLENKFNFEDKIIELERLLA
jgi:glycosyltransferase involved in cell wall biosynthesis